MNTFEIKSIDRDEIITMLGINKERLQLGGFEANFVNVIRQYPAETRIELMQLSEQDCLLYFKEKKQSYKEFVLEILSKKWFWRETGDRFYLKDVECEFIDDCPTYQKVKFLIKKDKISIDILSKIIEFFTKDYSKLYQQD